MDQNTTLDAAKTALTHGAKVGVSTEVRDVIVNLFREMLGENRPAFFQTPIGAALEPLVATAAIHYAAAHMGESLPHADKVKRMCELAMEADGRDLLAPLLKSLEPAFRKIGGVRLPKEKGEGE